MYINYDNRIFGLDLVRAIAILLVLSSHSTLLLFPNQHTLLLDIIRFFGTVGVDLFFVLSGYLIGGIILKQIKNNKTSFKDFVFFWMRRWFRTLPNYFLILLLNIIMFYILFNQVVEDIGSYFVFIQNFSNPQPDFFTESWSLSIEEYAYIIGPLLLFVLLYLGMKTSKNKLYMAMVLTIVFGSVLFRFTYYLEHGFTSHHDWSQHIRKVVVYRLDSIYYGFLGAFVALNFKKIWQGFKNRFLALGIGLFFGMHFLIFIWHLQPENAPFFYTVFYLPLLSISLLLLFPCFTDMAKGKFLKKQISSISILSYGLYLVNYSLVLLTIQYFIDVTKTSLLEKLSILLVYWFLSFILAYFLYRYYEKPIMNLRDSKFIKNRFK